MFKVIKSINFGNNGIDKSEGLKELKGWVVGTPHKTSIMCVVVTCKYQNDFVDKADYESNRQSMEEQFEKDLLSVGLTKEYISKNAKTILPKEVQNIEEPKPMTFRDWQKSRK